MSRSLVDLETTPVWGQLQADQLRKNTYTELKIELHPRERVFSLNATKFSVKIKNKQISSE